MKFDFLKVYKWRDEQNWLDRWRMRLWNAINDGRFGRTSDNPEDSALD